MPKGTYVNRLLIEMDAVIDLDIGIAHLINSEYNNPEFVNTKMLGLSDWDYKTLLLNRRFENPLRMFVQSAYWGDIDDLRSQMFNDPDVYDRILKASPTTGIFTIINEVLKTGAPSFKVTILCHTQQEAIHIRKLFPDGGIDIAVSDDEFHKEFDVSDYDTIFVKNIFTPMNFKSFVGKNLYVCIYRFNLDEENFEAPNIEAYKDYHFTKAIDIYLIDVYSNTSINFAKTKEDIPDDTQ